MRLRQLLLSPIHPNDEVSEMETTVVRQEVNQKGGKGGTCARCHGRIRKEGCRVRRGRGNRWVCPGCLEEGLPRAAVGDVVGTAREGQFRILLRRAV